MNIRNIVLALLSVILFAACDNIGEDDRYITVEGSVSDRVVLLTEFTGMKCVNCPNAAKIAHDMLEKYPNNLIVVAMHPKGHGFVPEGATPDLARPEAMDYLKAMGGSLSTGLPTGVVDFVENGSSFLMDRSEWAARIVQRVAVEAQCGIALEKNHKGGASYEVKATLSPKNNYSGKVSLIFWLVESGMVGSQASHEEGIIRDYVHNHALRECLNGVWGKELGSLSGSVEESVSFEVKPEYVANNCTVVAVAVNPATHEVLQAAEIALGNATGGNQSTSDAPMYLKYEGKTITKDTSVVITKVIPAFTEGTFEMKFDCSVVNNTKKDVDYTVHEERNFDLTKYTTSGCVDQCISGNGEKTQTWDLGTLAPEEEKSFQGHFEIGKDVAGIDGKFEEVFTFSDGTNKIKVNVTFDYKAQK